MDLRTYLRAVQRSWWLVTAAIVLGILAGEYVNLTATKIYAATVTFYISTPSSAAVSAASSDQFAQNRANSYAKLLTSDKLASMVVSASGVQLSPADVSAEITGAADINTVLVTATIQDPSTTRGLRIARAVAHQFPTLVHQLDGRTADQGSVQLVVVSGPSVAAAPVLPRKSLNLLYGAAAGIIVGLLLAVIRFIRDTSVRTREDIEEISGRPSVGSVGFVSAARRHPIVWDLSRPSALSESYRRLRTNLQFVEVAVPVSTIVVTSAQAGEGKSSSAANLARVFAEGGRSVVLVDADLRRPSIAGYFGLEGGVGLSNVLVNDVSLDEALQVWREGSMSILAAGTPPPNPSELLGSDSMRSLVQTLRQRFDLVIFDTPPVLPVTDAAVLAGEVDGVLLVCRYGKTRRGQFATAVASLRAVNAKLLGGVLMMHPTKGRDATDYANAESYAPSDQKGSWWRRTFGRNARTTPNESSSRFVVDDLDEPRPKQPPVERAADERRSAQGERVKNR